MDWKKELKFQRDQVAAMLYLSKDDLFLMAVSIGVTAAFLGAITGIHHLITE